MSKAYVLLQFNLDAPEKFISYRQHAAPTIQSHGGKVLVAAAAADVREGSLPAKQVTVIEFPSRDAAEAWYGSSEYADFKHLRHEATSMGSLAFLDGFMPPAAPVKS
jgi:uncharacterized protein (DUF1330 family)